MKVSNRRLRLIVMRNHLLKGVENLGSRKPVWTFQSEASLPSTASCLRA
jgi:hypothetical protein